MTARRRRRPKRKRKPRPHHYADGKRDGRLQKRLPARERIRLAAAARGIINAGDRIAVLPSGRQYRSAVVPVRRPGAAYRARAAEIEYRRTHPESVNGNVRISRAGDPARFAVPLFPESMCRWLLDQRGGLSATLRRLVAGAMLAAADAGKLDLPEDERAWLVMMARTGRPERRRRLDEQWYVRGPRGRELG